MNRSLNLREQFDRDTKGHDSYQEYCRVVVDKKPTAIEQTVAICREARDAAKRHDELLMYNKHPLDCPEFDEEWLRRWDLLGRLLEAPAVRECQFEQSKTWYAADLGTVAQMLRQGTKYDLGLIRRVCLLDGTIIREWGAK